MDTANFKNEFENEIDEDDDLNKEDLNLINDNEQEENNKNNINNSIAFLNENFSSQVDLYYEKKKEKFLNDALIDNDYTEINNEQSYKSIFRFSKQQSNKLDLKLCRAELPKFKHNFLESGNDRLTKLLDKRHLKSRKIIHEDDSDYDEENDNDCSNEYKLSLNEAMSKKFNQHCEKMKLRKNILMLMYNKSIQNQENSKKFTTFNSLEKCLSKISSSDSHKKSKHNSRPKTCMNKLDYEHKLNKEAINYNRPKTGFLREKIEEKTNFDVSRNYLTQNYPFRISTNDLNSRIEIFKPIQTNYKEDIDLNKRRVNRPKSSISSFSSMHENKTPNRLNSPSLSQNMITVNMQELLKKSKILEAKCLSTLWVNYNV